LNGLYWVVRQVSVVSNKREVTGKPWRIWLQVGKGGKAGRRIGGSEEERKRCRERGRERKRERKRVCEREGVKERQREGKREGVEKGYKGEKG
jgi:hypothetical protein